MAFKKTLFTVLVVGIIVLLQYLTYDASFITSVLIMVLAVLVGYFIYPIWEKLLSK